MDDLLIRNALVFDGSGAEPALQDLAVRQGRIRAVGRELPVDAARILDADGLALMPGIIDSHTHFDAQITWDPSVHMPSVLNAGRHRGQTRKPFSSSICFAVSGVIFPISMALS